MSGRFVPRFREFAPCGAGRKCGLAACAAHQVSEVRMVPSWAPGREHGVPLVPGSRHREKEWCGRGESNPQVVAHGGFSYLYGFRRPRWKRLRRHR